jgi:hypothetical protein
MPYCLSSYGWIQDPESDAYLYSVSFASYNTSDTSELTEKQQEKVQNAVEKAFEGLTAGEIYGEMYDEFGEETQTEREVIPSEGTDEISSSTEAN